MRVLNAPGADDFNTVQSLLQTSAGAKFRKADLHVHTPASQDIADRWKDATPTDVVTFALEAGLEIIAITDHNTVAWCDLVRDAAHGTDLHVLPGVEVSTPHGHLLAIFDESTTSTAIREFLIQAGFTGDRYGSLNAASSKDMDTLAQCVDHMGGLAIAAHVDSNNGLMRFPVADERNRVAASPYIRAFEITNPDRRSVYQDGAGFGIDRHITCIMASDGWTDGKPQHQLDAIGSRFTEFKIESISTYAIKQSLHDPDLRVRLPNDSTTDPNTIIHGAWIRGGFLDGEILRFSDNLTCIIGDTESGKSFAIELMRSALQQQASIEKISSEITSLLSACLEHVSRVVVVLTQDQAHYTVEQTFTDGAGDLPIVRRVTETGLDDVDSVIDVPTFFPIKAYSQSEILEFARQPESRLSLTDDLIDIRDEQSLVKGVKARLRSNAAELLESQRQLKEAADRLSGLGAIQEQIHRITELLGHPRVVSHGRWTSEQRILNAGKSDLTSIRANVDETFPAVPSDLFTDTINEPPNPEVLKDAAAIGSHLRTWVKETKSEYLNQIDKSLDALAELRKGWDKQFLEERRRYEGLLRTIDTDGIGLPTLSRKLESLKDDESTLLALKRRVDDELRPAIDAVNSRREDLLNEVQRLRRQITRKREAKAAQLTQALDRRILVEVKSDGNDRKLHEKLLKIRVGSRVQVDDIERMAKALHPVPFVKSLLREEFSELEELSGVRAASFSRLYSNIVDRGLFSELYNLQIVDVDDIIGIRFAVSPGEFRDLEMLAHGQKCTVVLAVAMAEGDFPLIVDQPEDALHAPYIEDNIVATLRNHRGQRQYIFATRNANVLVSGDAEQVIVMDADSKTGRVQRTGSIDQFDTRDLVLLHLEGGRTAFDRKRLKYSLDSL